MKVILLRDMDNLGAQGEIVDVKNGYGRNYLIPNQIARLATDSAVRAIEEERRQQARKLAQRQEDAENLARQIESLELVVTAKVGEESRIFGTITAQNISDALASEGITIERKHIELNEEIKTLGVYSASVRVHSEVSATVKFRVDPEHLAARA